jgi:hypothetical protein
MRIVEFVKDANDWGDGPAILATGIRRMYFISPHIVRVTFVRADVDDNGVEEQRVSGHIDCDIDQLDAILALIHRGLGVADQPRDKPAVAQRRVEH